MHSMGPTDVNNGLCCRSDASEGAPNTAWGKLCKRRVQDPFQQALMQHMWRGSKRAAKTAEENRPELADVEEVVKQLSVPFFPRNSCCYNSHVTYFTSVPSLCRRIYRGHGRVLTKRELQLRSAWTGLPLSTWTGASRDTEVVRTPESYHMVKDALSKDEIPGEWTQVCDNINSRTDDDGQLDSRRD
jgi:hypothetical protein